MNPFVTLILNTLFMAIAIINLKSDGLNTFEKIVNGTLFVMCIIQYVLIGAILSL